jgi:hypothetical protein
MRSDNREAKQAWKAEQRAAAQAAFPLPDAVLVELFAFVDAAVGEQGCDDTRRLTLSWLQSHNITPDAVLAWLEETGGYCDCEVVANSMERWEENR